MKMKWPKGMKSSSSNEGQIQESIEYQEDSSSLKAFEISSFMNKDDTFLQIFNHQLYEYKIVINTSSLNEGAFWLYATCLFNSGASLFATLDIIFTNE
jgi:hypothetical protein